jgi:hypothetical protein
MSGLFSLFRRLRRRTWKERATLLLAAPVCLCMWGGLRIVSFQRLVRWTGVVSPFTRHVGRSTIDRVTWAVRAAGRRLFPARPCLPQALAARFLLSCLGVPTELRIGVQRSEEDDLCAHAWLEHNGKILIGGSDSPTHYHTLAAS